MSYSNYVGLTTACWTIAGISFGAAGFLHADFLQTFTSGWIGMFVITQLSER